MKLAAASWPDREISPESTVEGAGCPKASELELPRMESVIVSALLLVARGRLCVSDLDFCQGMRADADCAE
jgi:hypothetical protein